jgi:selenocysteine-specific elongation factor
MSVAQINVTIGTAGHIDHGKTALVKLLTGCDTDRLKEEKERGMSIDLGFAPCRIADTEIGIVDVPGHESFIKTMVAGAAGMDGVILVVAADDGVMPQTREHLDILTLLGVRHGLVALTKVDRVDQEYLQIVRAEIEEFLRGTFLEGAPVCPLSNITGEGFDGFYQALAELSRAIRPKPIDGVFRLPLDRAFSARGYGTVVAGIPVSGSARAGDEVVLLPHGQTGRIRQMEVYGRVCDTVMAGQCAALNIRHWDHRVIHRGHTVAAPGYFSPNEWYACRLRTLPDEKVVLKNGTQLKLHTGTSEVSAAIYLIEGDRIEGGGEHLVQLRATSPVVAGPGDHFIVRASSPLRTIGGGMIIEATPRRLKRNRPEVCEDLRQRAEAVLEDERFVEYCVRKAPSLAARDTELSTRAKIRHVAVGRILDKLTHQGKIIALPGALYLHLDTAAETGQRVLDVVGQYHRESPESPGMTLEQLRQSLPIDRAVLDGVVALLSSDGRLVERSGRLARQEHQATFRDEDARRLEAVESEFRQQAFHPPSLEEVGQKIGASPQTTEKLVKILCEHQRLVQVAEGLLFHCEAVRRAQEILVDFLQQEGRLESVRFKYLLDTTRKFAIPLLDYFDRSEVTRRVGNTRYLKTPRGGGPPG